MLKPVFTEKSLKEAKLGNYTFQVPAVMNKKQIASKVAKIFGVKVVKVKTVKINGVTLNSTDTKKLCETAYPLTLPKWYKSYND